MEMRIALDARLLFHREGGIAEYTRQLIAGLATLVEDERLVVLHSARDRSAAFVPRLPAVRRRGLWTPAHHRWEQPLLGFELRLLRADVLHCPDFIVPRHWHQRSVVTIHDLAFLRFPHTVTAESARYYGQVGESVHRSDHIIAVSQHTKRDVVELLGVPPHRVSVVYEAADPVFQPVQGDGLTRAWCAERGLEPGYILFVGTLEPRKNLPLLLKAFERLVGRARHEVHLVVAGNPGWLYEDFLDTVQRSPLGRRVRFLGGVGKTDLVMLYNGAGLLAFPSLYEGFGLPLLEAMACGTPVVASNVSSIPEVAGSAGLLLEPDDERSWAAALEQVLLDSVVRERMRQEGFRQVARFSWRLAAEQTLAVYRGVVKAA